MYSGVFKKVLVGSMIYDHCFIAVLSTEEYTKSRNMGCSRGVCLVVGEKPDKELPGIVGARGDTV